MKVLLTGSSGFLGRYVLESLHRREIATLAIGRHPPAGPGADFIAVDLLAAPDFDALCRSAGVTHLIHLAWYAEHGQYWASPLNLRWTEASVRLVEAFCRAGGRQVVAAGTCAEYDWSHGYCREDATPLNPATLYGVAKDATRRLVSAVCDQAQIPCAWGRIFLPFGQGESSQRLIPSLIDVFQGRRLPFGVNATAYRDFLHASDVAEGFFALLHAGANGAYNVSSGEPVRIGELVRALAGYYDADPRPVLDLTTERQGEPRLLVGESLGLRAFGWKPQDSTMGHLLSGKQYVF
ncbi:NAD-dependent epimerase/dehydratase family protein [Thiocystis violascens]|uniref:Nucleoside-diphosphate-sugar epimerase n=1 Tax=Thiocystis violascens (strain ATCC 17096 / DSM 198 / 6111) TaxID=765911 RepID=I3Y7F3_THIV6|nr:NAD(P)-dependent oxidoreductase [Thiocystis violascens]AFL72921.1 nucleoside-diphosphate-sugar epimerase [Thiocystis violascens DSM 198]